MSQSVTTGSLPRAATATSRTWKRWRPQLHFVPTVPVLLLVLVVVSAAVADWAPFDPNEVDLSQKLLPPQTAGHVLGTDALGRDLFSRLVHGSRISLEVALLSVLGGSCLGIALGLAAGSRGGRVDAIVMRLTEITLGFPLIIVAILLASIYGPNLGNVVLVIALFQWPQFARLVRAQTVQLRERQFVLAARVSGASTLHIVRRHYVPHVSSSLFILASILAAGAIQIEAGLDFFGAGIAPPAPSWGSIINDGRPYILTAWWICAAAGLAISFMVLSLNMLGDYLRDALDPQLKSVS